LSLTSGAFILPDGFIAGMATYCRIFITGMIIAGFPAGWTGRGLRGYLNLRKNFRKIGSTLDQIKTAKIMIAIETRI
jgi:fructose-specific phosphotransferase system IIC component